MANFLLGIGNNYTPQGILMNGPTFGLNCTVVHN